MNGDILLALVISVFGGLCCLVCLDRSRPLLFLHDWEAIDGDGDALPRLSCWLVSILASGEKLSRRDVSVSAQLSWQYCTESGMRRRIEIETRHGATYQISTSQ